jgi:mono/diheme cytochrome c family protein
MGKLVPPRIEGSSIKETFMPCRPISNKAGSLLRFTGILSVVLLSLSSHGAAAESSVDRGRYLVTLGGCNDCHTPGYFLGKPDMGRFLGGSDVGFSLPGLGAFVGPNLTPDRETGLGSWSREEIVTAIQTGITPDGRELAPVMPWRAFAGLTKTDASAIADFLRSLPPVTNDVPGPFGPSEKPKVLLMKVVPPSD